MTDAAGYREWGVAPELARHVVCTWAGQFGQQGEQYTDRVFPDGCIDIVWTDGGLILAGPDTAAVPLEWRPGAWFAGIRFRPGLAPAVLGVPASAVLDTRVELGDVMGDRARALDDHLRRAPSLRAAAGALVAAVRGWLPAAAPADRLVEAAVATLRTSDAPRPVALLAGQLGVSERQLHRRFVAAVGYGPKLLHRILRLRRFLRLAAGDTRRNRAVHRSEAAMPGGRLRGNIAALAQAAGYADHAHLVRDCQELAGLPPTRLIGRPITDA